MECRKPFSAVGESVKKKSPALTRGTLPYFKNTTWHNLNLRTVNGKRPNWKDRSSRFYLSKGILLCFSKNEFYRWCDDQKEKILAIYAAGETPSIDRINREEHYCFSNMQIIPKKENVGKANKLKQKAVEAVCEKDPSIVLYFSGQREAARFGFDQSYISQVCLNKRKSHRGYFWRFSGMTV